MRIGILTFHHTTNYGATLQAYALSTTLKSQGHDVELVDYRPYKAVRFYTRELVPISIGKKPHLNHHALTNLLKAWKMRKFLLSKMKLSDKKFYRRAGLKYFNCLYDVLICGSDQVWCTNSIRGFDPSYFLDFVRSQTTRKVSYAASFSETKTLGDNRVEVCKLISRFNTILVRDSHSLKLVSEECEKQATKVLDPTFLINYENIVSPPKLKDDYLLVYRQAPLQLEEESLIKLIAKARDLAIISVGKYNKVADKNLISVSPEEWLGFFSKASYVVTNTYHGSIFSIIFQRLFTVLFAANKSNKTEDLLNHLGLESRLLRVENKPRSVEDFFRIDYSTANKILEVEVLKSKTCLLEALESK